MILRSRASRRCSWARLPSSCARPRREIVLDFNRSPLPDEALVHDAAGEFPAPQNQSPSHAVQDHVALVHAEIQERLRAVLVQDEDRRLLGLGREREARVHAIIGGGDRLNARVAAIPVVEVPRAVRVER